MRAYAAGTLLQGMRSLRPGSDVGDRLDDALATKLVGVLRFRRHHFMAALCDPPHAAAVFLAHSVIEQAHADAIARRMVQLGMEPTFSPAALDERGHAPLFEPGNGLAEMAREGHDALRLSMTALVALARSVGPSDKVTRKLVVDIVAEDQARAADLAKLAKTPASA